MSSITIAELAFGVEKRRSDRLERAVRAFLLPITVLPFEEAAAWRYGVVYARLPIGPLDGMIATHAIASGRTLVTNNAAHFSRIDGLDWEDWY